LLLDALLSDDAKPLKGMNPACKCTCFSYLERFSCGTGGWGVWCGNWLIHSRFTSNLLRFGYGYSSSHWNIGLRGSSICGGHWRSSSDLSVLLWNRADLWTSYIKSSGLPIGLLPGWPLFLESHGKSWNLVRPFSRPGKSWKTAKVVESHGKWWWCPGIFFVKMH